MRRGRHIPAAHRRARGRESETNCCRLRKTAKAESHSSTATTREGSGYYRTSSEPVHRDIADCFFAECSLWSAGEGGAICSRS
jgi:hypothetical protein